MSKRKFGLLFCVFLFSAPSHGEGHYAVDMRARTRPSAVNLWGTAAYDGKLWGEAQKENPFYGYYRVGAKAGGNPSYAAFFQIAPIAPLIFEVQRGDTHRFLDIATLNCNSVECKGKVERTDYSVRLLAGYQNFVFSGSALWREIRTPSTSKFVGLETEAMVVSSGFHRYFETNLIVGYKLPEDRTVGASLTDGLMSEGDKRMSSAYGFYRFSAMGL